METGEQDRHERVKRAMYDAHRWAVRKSGIDLGTFEEALASGVVADSWDAMAEAAIREAIRT